MNEVRIRNAAERATTVANLMTNAGYSYTNPGSNTIRKIQRVIGKRVYREISSHRRHFLPKNKWTSLKRG